MIPEIAFIAPDHELYLLAEKISSKIDEPILLEEGYLHEALEIANTLEKKGLRVLISRGGTTRILRNSNIQLPIIDIPITEFDIVRILNQAKKYSRRIAVVGYDILIRGAKEVGPILDIDVETFLVKSGDDVSETMQMINDLQIKVVVGPKLPVEAARKYGITGLLIESQEQVVEGSINEAVKLLNAIKKERIDSERIKTVFNSISEGIISFDCKGAVMNYNSIAAKTLSIPEDLNVKDYSLDVLISLGIREAVIKGEIWNGEVRDIAGNKYVCNLTPILDGEDNQGASFIFKELREHDIIEQKVRRSLYDKGLIAKYNFQDIVYKSKNMERTIEIAKNYALTDSTVLIEGETGTGKEIFAQSIHNHSLRNEGAFIAVNCAALPENLLESELFGYIEGAFTGARKGGKRGLFELAHKGTLFLDEIGEVSLSFQSRLLRVLEEKVVMRIGDDKIIPVDVRIICATNRSLKKMVEREMFRSDLYYRINILRLPIPALRFRREDILELIKYFIGIYNDKEKLNKNMVLREEIIDLLQNYNFPGNVRELKNMIERLVVSTKFSDLSLESFGEIIDISDSNYIDIDDVEIEKDKNVTNLSILEQEELRLIERILEECGGNKAICARKLGISKTTLWRKLSRRRI